MRVKITHNTVFTITHVIHGKKTFIISQSIRQTHYVASE